MVLEVHRSSDLRFVRFRRSVRRGSIEVGKSLGSTDISSRLRGDPHNANIQAASHRK
jgi:hypothetical protein